MSKTRTIILNLIFFFVLSTRLFAAVDIPSKVVTGETGRKLDEYCTRLAGVGFNGSVLVAQKGQVLYHNAFGISYVPDSTPIYTATAMSTGSVSKQFTAAGIMALEADGKLSVDDPISKFFENVPETKWDITIHDLLTHTSGLPPETGPDEDPITRDEFVRDLLARPLENKPGEHYEYSNAGYSLLAAIIEKVSGKSYEQYLHDRLFEPAGLTSTGMYLLDLPDSLIGHSQNPNLDYMAMNDRPRDAWHLTGSGGLLSTPADMYRWHLALKNNTVLSKEQTDQMFTPHVREHPDGPTYYGYGWVVQQSQRRNSTVIWHNGGAMPHGWGCAVYYYVNDDAVFIVFSNKPINGRNPVDAIALGMSQVTFGEGYALPPVWANVSPEVASKYEGTYRADDSMMYEFKAADDAITIIPRGQKACDLLYPSPMADRLPQYNELAENLITTMSRGEFKKAGMFWDMGATDQIVTMNERFWHSFDSLGSFLTVVSNGTFLQGDILTSCRLTFEQGSVELTIAWMRGKCIGIMDGDSSGKELEPLSDHEFAGFVIGLGTVPKVTFTAGTVTIDTGMDVITAQRM